MPVIRLSYSGHKLMGFYSKLAFFQFQQSISLRVSITPLQSLQFWEVKLNAHSLLFQIIDAKFLVIDFSSMKVLSHSLPCLFICLSPFSL